MEAVHLTWRQITARAINLRARYIVILLVVSGCYWDDPAQDHPYPICAHPAEWEDKSCAQVCESRLSASCVESSDCGATPAGYKRLDACSEGKFGTELPFSCDEPLPKSLSESFYLVSCCCGGSAGETYGETSTFESSTGSESSNT